MANTIKSALFVDYDSFHRSLKAAKTDLAESLAQRAAALVAAIESGGLVSPASDEPVKRRTLVRRCYADPRRLEKNRAALIAAGFEVIDCPPLEGRERNAAEIHMVLDTMDALEHPTGYEEFMLLSADADLTPVLLRLRAHDRATVIFANDVTAANYKAIADGMVEEAAFVALLSGEEPAAKPKAEPEPAAPAPKPTVADRGAIETLARKVHSATNVPMLSPRAFADLFRLLAEEIRQEGYHFQKTAENLTNRLAEAGRNVNRRQVLFVVKGLALKGHVFSNDDSSEKLAEVFREQVLYLVGSAGLELSDEEVALLPAWISGSAIAPAAKLAATPARPLSERAARKPALSRRSARSAEKEAESEGTTAKAEPEAAAGYTAEKPKPVSKPVLDRLAEIKATTAQRLAARKTGKAARANKPSDEKPAPRRKAVAAKAAPSTENDAAPEETGDKKKPRARATKTSRPAAKESGDKDALETSILAAIAEAVDVLVEDGDDAPEQAPSAKQQADAVAAEQEPELVEVEAEAEAAYEADDFAEAEEPPVQDAPVARADSDEPAEEDGDDIGDEIQRIIASYSRARKQG